MLAFVFIHAVIIIIAGTFVEVPLVMEGLFFSAFFAAQFIAETGRDKDFAADFALTEAEFPVRHTVHVVGNYRIKGTIHGYTFDFSAIIRIPEGESCFL